MYDEYIYSSIYTISIYTISYIYNTLYIQYPIYIQYPYILYPYIFRFGICIIETKSQSRKKKMYFSKILIKKVEEAKTKKEKK